MAGLSTSYDFFNGRQEHMETCSAQTQTLISLEATKEKIYTVYGNVINIIEELEDRTQKQHGRHTMPKSSTDYYDHSEKCDDTVEEIVQAQLLAFQVILNGCHPRVKEDLRDELKDKTKQWVAFRQQKRIQRDIVDTYTDRLMAIITKGKTTHARELLDSKSETYSSFGKDDVQNILNSFEKGSEVEAKFQKDPTLKAEGPVIRAVMNDDAHFISITGYKDVLLVLTNDGKLLSFKYEEENQKWKVHLNQNGLTSFTHIYELPRDQQVLAIDESGKLYYSDGNLEKWTPVNEEGGAILKLIIDRTAVIAINEQKKFWKMCINDPLKWNKKRKFEDNFTDCLSNALESMHSIDVTLGKETKIWVISPELKNLSCDQNQFWESEHPANKIEFEKIYANQWNGQVWAVDTVGNVYFREFYCFDNKSSWKTEEGDPKVQMMATIDQGVFGLDMKNVIWYRKVTPPNYLGNWERWGGLSDILPLLKDTDLR